MSSNLNLYSIHSLVNSIAEITGLGIDGSLYFKNPLDTPIENLMQASQVFQNWLDKNGFNVTVNEVHDTLGE